MSGSQEVRDMTLCQSKHGGRNSTIVNEMLKKSPAMERQPSEGKLSHSTSYTLTATPSISTTSPTFSRKARPRPATDLIIIPYTHEEWKIVMEEVKILYLKGQYKQCSMRCKHILDSIKNTHQAHILYSIYLCFFTSNSLEMTARSLHNHSSNKLALFREALSFYKKAKSLMEYDHPRSNSSICSSIHSSRSSLDSVNSQTSTTYTFSSGSDERPSVPVKGPLLVSTTSPTTARMKKKVSFSTKMTTLPSASDLSETTFFQAFPLPPSAREEITLPPPPEKDFDHNQDLCTLSSYLLSQSTMRYHAQLTALFHQLTYHITSIHYQIATQSEIRRTRRLNPPNLFFEGERDASWVMEGVRREEIVKVELQERIRRLKERGWQRERFDGERYRVLCERALVEAEDGVRGLSRL